MRMKRKRRRSRWSGRNRRVRMGMSAYKVSWSALGELLQFSGTFKPPLAGCDIARSISN